MSTIDGSVVVDKVTNTVTCTGVLSFGRTYVVVFCYGEHDTFTVDGEPMRNYEDQSEALDLAQDQVLATLLAK